MRNKTILTWGLSIFMLFLLIFIVFIDEKNNEFILEDDERIIDNATQVENKDTLKGKVMVSFGDSVTEFGDYTDVISRRTRMTVYNIGFGGTRMAHHTSTDYDPFSFSYLVKSIVNNDFNEQQSLIDKDNPFSPRFKLHFKNLKEIDFSNVDFISVFLGTNDYMGTKYGGVVPLGNETDSTRDTFYGGINVAVEILKEAYPNIEVIFVTPTWRMNNEQLGGGSAEENPNEDGYYLIEYVDALIDRGEYYNIPTLDLYRESGINKETQSIYLADDVHPNDEGFKHIGNMISDFIISYYK
ncbi:SGNH/GDSL hydrolase family protein [Halolactibacillus miurensis]|nr:SGNH/GDSL hydrolase family protein [Halolactibacillus miurensis]